jgi:hypothetical protein
MTPKELRDAILSMKTDHQCPPPSEEIRYRLHQLAVINRHAMAVGLPLKPAARNLLTSIRNRLKFYHGQLLFDGKDVSLDFIFIVADEFIDRFVRFLKENN